MQTRPHQTETKETNLHVSVLGDGNKTRPAIAHHLIPLI